MNTRSQIAREIARQRAASLLISSVERDLMTALVGDSSAGAGISGSEESLSILHRRVPVQLAARGADDPVILADLERSTYGFTAGEAISVQREIIGFDDAGERGDAGDAGDAGEGSLGGDIYRVRFRYHDGASWRSSFDSLQADALPRAVEVAVWFNPWPGEQLESPADGQAVESAERLTFDAGAGFDESAYAELSDLDTFDEPPPDRLRVIHVPDSAGDE